MKIKNTIKKILAFIITSSSIYVLAKIGESGVKLNSITSYFWYLGFIILTLPIWDITYKGIKDFFKVK